MYVCITQYLLYVVESAHYGVVKTLRNTKKCILWHVLLLYVLKKFSYQFPKDGVIIMPEHVGAM